MSGQFRKVDLVKRDYYFLHTFMLNIESLLLFQFSKDFSLFFPMKNLWPHPTPGDHDLLYLGMFSHKFQLLWPNGS